MKAIDHAATTLPVIIEPVPKDAQKVIAIVGRMLTSLERAQKSWYGVTPALPLTDAERSLLARVNRSELVHLRYVIQGIAESVAKQAAVLVGVIDAAMANAK
jgi:hypothetical protein